MSDLQRYIQQRKLRDPVFAKDFESGYESFKAEVLQEMNLSQHLDWLQEFPLDDLEDLYLVKHEAGKMSE